jgi:hypothetical protein
MTGVIRGSSQVSSGGPGSSEHVFLDASHPPRDGLEVSPPVVLDGLVQDWDALERLWERAMARHIKVDLRETPVLMAEKPYHSPKSRQRCVDEGNYCAYYYAFYRM